MAESGSSFALDQLSLIERATGGSPPPPVAALHLPPKLEPGNKDGEFGALELADGSIGLSYLLLNDTRRALREGRRLQDLAGVDALWLARHFLSDDALERALGLAAINAVSQHLFNRFGYRRPDAGDSIGLLDPRPGERIGMVGLFPPLVRRILDAGAELVVVELDARLAGAREGYRVSLDHRELGHCDKVLSTTTLMLNDTVDSVIAACASAASLVMIGPGGGCLPDALFQRGVTALGGSEIIDRNGFVNAMATGQSWGAYARKTLIRRERYPGAANLPDRVGQDAAGMP